MNRQICSLIVALSLFVTGSLPGYGYAANSCDDLFSFSREDQFKEHLEALIRKHYDIEPNRSMIAELFLMYGMRHFKLSKLERPFDVRRSVVESEHAFEVAHRFVRNFEKDYSTSDVQWVERNILSRGIDPLVKEYFVPKERPRIWKLINMIFNNRAVQFAMNLRSLPYWSDRAISESLMEKILRDGPEVHKKAIEDAYSYKGQNVVQGYRQISKLYASFFIALLSYTAWTNLNTVDDEINKKRAARLEDALNDLADLIQTVDKEMESRGLYKVENK